MSAADPDPPSAAAMRQAIYGLLARAFARPPTGGDLECLADPALRQALAGLSPEPLPASLKFRETPDGSTQASAYQEFQNLFHVPGGQQVAPYESVFRGTREIDGKSVAGLLCGPPVVEVQAWYRLAALEIATDYQDLPDHVAMELAYLAHLCGKEEEFTRNGDASRLWRTREMQRDFLAGHLAAWAGALASAIRQRTVHPYFIALADLLEDFSRRDLARLERDLGSSRSGPLPDYATAPE